MKDNKGNINVLGKRLSPLEKDVLEVLWKRKEAKVKDIHKRIITKRIVAYTSVAVILDRLHDKGLVTRNVESCRGGFRYLYRSSTSKEEYKKTMVKNAVDKIVNNFGSIAVAYFNERFGNQR